MSATPRRSHSRVVTMLAAVMAVAVATLGFAACSSEPEPQVHEYVIPNGSRNRIAKGERVEVWSGNLTVRVGDTLRVRNEDIGGFPFGPYRVEPMSEFEIVFGAPGVYTGYCPLIGDADTYTLVVVE